MGFSIEPTIRTDSPRPRTMPVEHAELPVWNPEGWNSEDWSYEDWQQGHRIGSLRRDLAGGEGHLFATLTDDHHPHLQDQAFAESQGNLVPYCRHLHRLKCKSPAEFAGRTEKTS